MASGEFGGAFEKKKMLEKHEQSQYVYENKQISDKRPEKIRTFMSKIRTFASNLIEFFKNLRILDGNLPVRVLVKSANEIDTWGAGHSCVAICDALHQMGSMAFPYRESGTF